MPCQAKAQAAITENVFKKRKNKLSTFILLIISKRMVGWQDGTGFSSMEEQLLMEPCIHSIHFIQDLKAEDSKTGMTPK